MATSILEMRLCLVTLPVLTAIIMKSAMPDLPYVVLVQVEDCRMSQKFRRGQKIGGGGGCVVDLVTDEGCKPDDASKATSRDKMKDLGKPQKVLMLPYTLRQLC